MIWLSDVLVLSGIHMCAVELEGNAQFLTEMTWMLGTAWETLALSLAVWITIKHFRELQRTSTGWAVGDCYTILIQTHVFYFARWGRNLNIVIFSRSHSWHTSFFVVSCRHFLYLSPKILVCHLWLTRLHPTISHYFYRTQIRLALKSSLILLQLPMSCRCLWLDHASSLAFETIRLNSWPTPTRELPWVQLLSSADKFQLAVVCSVEDARIVHTRGVPHGKHMNFGWFRSSSYVFIASNTVFRSMYIIITGDSLWFIPSQAIFDVPSFCTFLKLLDLHLNGNLLTVKECHRVHCSTFNWRHQECCTREISTPSDSFVERLR